MPSFFGQVKIGETESPSIFRCIQDTITPLLRSLSISRPTSLVCASVNVTFIRGISCTEIVENLMFPNLMLKLAILQHKQLNVRHKQLNVLTLFLR